MGEMRGIAARKSVRCGQEAPLHSVLLPAPALVLAPQHKSVSLTKSAGPGLSNGDGEVGNFKSTAETKTAEDAADLDRPPPPPPPPPPPDAAAAL